MAKSKSKKRKLNNTHPYNAHSKQSISNSNSNASANQDLTHEEIWDDSALLRSWDEAVAEYEFYHSIHARGEDVDEVLKQYHATNDDVNGNPDDGDNRVASGSADEGEILDSEEGEIGGEEAGESDHQLKGNATMMESHVKDLVSTVNEQINDAIPLTSASPSDSQSRTQASKADGDKGILNGHAQLPEPIAAQSNPVIDQDPAKQTLENIKMAYYWAGYYSGLYDGQNQAQVQAQDKGQVSNQGQA